MTQMKLKDLNQALLANFAKNWGWYLAWGIILILLGALAISFATLSTLATVVFLGTLLLIAGIIVIMDSFKCWQKHRMGDFFLQLLTGLIYLGVGSVFIMGPGITAISLTLILAISFIVLGVVRMYQAIVRRLPFRGWRLFNGIITFLLGIMILLGWPVSGLVILGVFVGIELIILGWLYVMGALTAHRAVK